MQTIGRHKPHDIGYGDVHALCDWCGAKWHHSKLERKPGGLFACPTCAKGKTELELDRGNAMGARSSAKRRPPKRGGRIVP